MNQISGCKVLSACARHPGSPKQATVIVADLPGPRVELVLITTIKVWVNIHACDVITSPATMLLLLGGCVTLGKRLHLSEFTFANLQSA